MQLAAGAGPRLGRATVASVAGARGPEKPGRRAHWKPVGAAPRGTARTPARVSARPCCCGAVASVVVGAGGRSIGAGAGGGGGGTAAPKLGGAGEMGGGVRERTATCSTAGSKGVCRAWGAENVRLSGRLAGLTACCYGGVGSVTRETGDSVLRRRLGGGDGVDPCTSLRSPQ